MSEPKTIKLIPLISLDTETQMKVRDLRNESDVRQWMYSDHEIGANEHLAWIHGLKQTQEKIVFAVMQDNSEPVGVVSVDNIDRQHKKAGWAFYLSASARGGLGSALEFALIEFVFSQLQLEKLNCEVIEGNDVVVKQHRKFFFKEEGFRREQLIKAGEKCGVHLLGLTKTDWLASRRDFLAQHQAVIDRFTIAIDWTPPAETERHPIDQIELARAKNNLNWMSILRLSLEKSPEVTSQIVAEIKQLDREIGALTDRLLNDDQEKSDGH